MSIRQVSSDIASRQARALVILACRCAAASAAAGAAVYWQLDD